jgi:hypothetical protein
MLFLRPTCSGISCWCVRALCIRRLYYRRYSFSVIRSLARRSHAQVLPCLCFTRACALAQIQETEDLLVRCKGRIVWTGSTAANKKSFDMKNPQHVDGCASGVKAASALSYEHAAFSVTLFDHGFAASTVVSYAQSSPKTWRSLDSAVR